MTTTRRILIALLATLALQSAAPAAGANVLWIPDLVITGDPTPTEHSIIRGTWSVVRSSLPSGAECLGGLEVRVVDRAESYFSSGSYAIASLYRGGPEPIVFIEHGKVTPANLAHEFAHHLDVSCGLGESDLGAAFQAAAGFGDGHDWYSGAVWADVPAEHFAEAVLVILGIGPLAIDVHPDAVALLADRLGGTASLAPDPATADRPARPLPGPNHR